MMPSATWPMATFPMAANREENPRSVREGMVYRLAPSDTPSASQGKTPPIRADFQSPRKDMRGTQKHGSHIGRSRYA